MKVKDAEKKFKKILKKYKVIIITFALFLLIGIISFVLDYFNIPYRLGFSFVFLNLDFWSIFLSNGIVVALFITTFTLFDKRTLEKDRLATYAGYLLLLDTYRWCKLFLEVLNKDIASNDYERDEIPDKQVELIKNQPFEKDEKIFEALENGQITKSRFEQYSKIKKQYQSYMMTFFYFKGFENIEKDLKISLEEDLAEEIKKIERDIQQY